MKVTLALCLLAAAVLVAATTTSAAGPPIIGTPLAVGKMVVPFEASAKAGETTIVEQIKIKPGGSFGWHSHGSPVAVVIQSGTLTLLDKSVANCAPQHLSKGQAAFEPANHVHLARNDTQKTVTLYAVYLALPKGVAPNKPATTPAGCSA